MIDHYGSCTGNPCVCQSWMRTCTGCGEVADGPNCTCKETAKHAAMNPFPHPRMGDWVTPAGLEHIATCDGTCDTYVSPTYPTHTGICTCVHIDGIWITRTQWQCPIHPCTICMMRGGTHIAHAHTRACDEGKAKGKAPQHTESTEPVEATPPQGRGSTGYGTRATAWAYRIISDFFL